MITSQVSIDHSMKDIPYSKADHNRFHKTLRVKAEEFIKRLRWKAFFFEKDEEVRNDSFRSITAMQPIQKHPYGTFGFKTVNTPPGHPNLHTWIDSVKLPFREVGQLLNREVIFSAAHKNSGTAATSGPRPCSLCVLDKIEYITVSIPSFLFSPSFIHNRGIHLQ